MRKLDIYHKDLHSYSIYLEKDFSALRDRLKDLDTTERKALIVTDENVAPLYLEEFTKKINSAFKELSTIVLSGGEEHKTLSEIEKIYEAALTFGLQRKDFMIALGGGVVGDMCGFASATYLRGMRFIQVPTTLLAQVDSSIGGKTGVDFHSYKNLVGAFHMPSLVYSAMHTLKTLPLLQYASGMGEVIKHALIHNPEYLPFLLEHKKELAERDTDTLLETIYQSNRIKKYFVEKDPFEERDRMFLNFGHSFGHAIERVADFHYSHGQCVAFGSLMALSLSKGIAEKDILSVEDLMRAVSLETRCKHLDQEAIFSAMKKDKKQNKDHLQFVLLHQLCAPYIENGLDKEEMELALNRFMEA